MAPVYGTLEGGREIILTFDDGPHLKWTPKLLDFLAAEGIKGLFFVLGNRVAAPGGKDIVRRAFNEGHQIGNHSYSHPDLTKLSEAKVREEISRTDALIAEFLGDHKLFRPPYGAHTSMVDRVIRDLGYHTVLWTVDPEDWKATNKPAKWINGAVERIRTRGNSIFLCHDIQGTTVENFPAFIKKVRELPKAHFIAYA